MGFWHGVVLGASAMALVVGFIALATWFSSTVDRWVPRQDFGVTVPGQQQSGTRPTTDPPSGAVPAVVPGAPEARATAPDPGHYAILAEQVASWPTPFGMQRAYDRTLFGQAWADTDRNGCDTRNDILGRDLTNPVFKDRTSECKVLTGGLIDPFSGSAVSFLSGTTTSIEVQIDHLVPLAWAWRNGASEWTDERRTEFANDPLNLLAVSGELNQQKSDSGPSEWLPPNRAFRCDYLALFATVVIEYSLTLPATDRTVMTELLEAC